MEGSRRGRACAETKRDRNWRWPVAQKDGEISTQAEIRMRCAFPALRDSGTVGEREKTRARRAS